MDGMGGAAWPCFSTQLSSTSRSAVQLATWCGSPPGPVGFPRQSWGASSTDHVPNPFNPAKLEQGGKQSGKLLGNPVPNKGHSQVLWPGMLTY